MIDSGETPKIADLKQQLILAKDDSSRIFILESIGFYYEVLNADSSLKYTQAALAYARKHSHPWAEARLMASLSSVLRQQGKFAEALDLLFKSLKIAKENNHAYDIARAYRRLGLVYFDLENFPKAVAHLLQAAETDEKTANKKSAAIDHVMLAEAYEKINKLDSAGSHIDIAFKQKDVLDLLAPDINNINGNIQVKKENYDQALFFYKEGFKLAQKNNDLVASSKICAGLADLFIKTNKRDSAIFYALKGIKYGQEASFKKGIILTGSLLSDLYDTIQPVDAIKYYRIAAAAKDSLFGVNNIQTIQDLVAREEARQKELEDARISYRNKLKIYGLVTGLAALLIIAFILYRNNKHKQKANVLLHQQKEKIEATLNELRSTQAQLIQSEKMASLGELTAGIAHEIQNPLNFVNNFSEINTELLKELKEERAKLTRPDKYRETGSDGGKEQRVETIEEEILNNITENESIILLHGKRAAAIVKGMLHHGQKNVGVKEPTDINTLAEEYLRLAYHGFRAKNPNFSAELKLDLDPALPPVNVIPQDMGRVLLNLYNNAFWACSERSLGGVGEKLRQGVSMETHPVLSTYTPTISLTTRSLNHKIEIRIRDNGPGIPQHIIDKIFQPFFTTKPPGQGTGLGLSLSYDIVKANGGEIQVKTETGEGCEFIIQVPV